MNSIVFWWSLDSFLYIVSCHQQIVSFISYLPIWMPFISLCCLIAVARTSDIMLNISGKSGYFYLVLDLKGKALSFITIRLIFLKVFHMRPLLC